MKTMMTLKNYYAIWLKLKTYIITLTSVVENCILNGCETLEYFLDTI